MKIIILGAGQVGGTLAEHLANEQNDITVVDTDGDRLRELQDRLDIGTVNGSASHPDTLYQAGADDADMLIAVTNSDEINMMACQIAHSLFNTPTKISRVRAPNYLAHQEKLFTPDNIPVDVIIGPEQLVTKNIVELIANPGALQVLDFADGRIQLVAVRAFHGGPIVGHELQDIRTHMPKVDTRVAAIFRRDRAIIPEGNTVVEADDEVFFIAARKDIRKVMSELRKIDKPYQRVMIAGGGNIGATLAQSIERDYQVKVIEQSYPRCRVLSESLKHAIVLHGSASEPGLLTSENIESTDVFCALTNNDESNIMMSMLAKRMGAKKVITLITNPAYADLVGDEIDIAISPQQITIGSLLTHVRRGDISNVHSLRRGAAEAIEVTARGDAYSSRVVGRRLEEINLPDGVTIGAIVRGDEVLIAHRHVLVETDDHVVLFLTDRNRISAVEKLFAVGFGFFS
ncbi:MAG TPA: Trk system potassium transporter TrkA [Halieaceae bacterium]|jgi:trk system potassium uptake protein TrkA|uniref:Trk system potassium transporter TrkA n=1 Tax=Haliea salexigens TaxID=287487 RepID=UPI000410E260|nr:Trk system potassium transporter TrkA [Haliea salexigens]MBK41885.1 Trk system potassium transporter TrkA [Haliea sp.]HBQ40111.1 Trk system potassium transporter TrkA [Halieaceae bacterium]MBP69937.1 Trk system potassium transporter TrkA [Haliea sp.]HBX72827.1 Trk system potassium transporter TrkA [Halieaceae bacterium]HCD56078.1 Trk system potassium transporter TrkA [Halieaceae bacterium]|tara:strand:- start:24236 stop:25612 length:1377 start_codon:yes stop_codon:yes gene_type:complete